MDISSKTRSLVEKGLVLDDHGAWISLVEKLGKERFFMHHLEAGEVLLGKTWVPIKDAIHATIEKKVDTFESRVTVNNDVVQPLELSNDHAGKEHFSDEPEITETNEITIQPGQFDNLKSRLPLKNITIVSDDLFYDHEHETIPFQPNEYSGFNDDEIIAVKKAMAKIKTAPVPIQEDVKGLLQSFEEFDIWEASAKKRQAAFWAAASGIAAILGCTAFLLLLFS